MDAEIGIIGGSGFYSLLEGAQSMEVGTKYGKPSSPISVGKIGSKKVAFIARHGLRHTISPQNINYRANIEALASLGVKRIITTSAVGSLDKDYMPGDFVILDQFINMTHGRNDTFYDVDTVVHVSTAYPYCEDLRTLGLKTAANSKIKHHKTGTVVVINGPRFSTKAESVNFSRMGANLINMTQYPEAALAREKGICYLGIAIVTDYDAGQEGEDDIKPVSTSEMLAIFGKNVEKAKVLVKDIVPKISPTRTCDCSKALEGAEITHK